MSHTVYTALMKQTYMLCVSPTWCTKCPAHWHEDAIVKNSQCVTSGFKPSTFLLAATQYKSFTLCFRREPVCRWHVWTQLCSHMSCHSCCYTPPGTKWTDRNTLNLTLWLYILEHVSVRGWYSIETLTPTTVYYIIQGLPLTAAPCMAAVALKAAVKEISYNVI